MIELLVLDVDGCLTDGSITYTQNGDEIKSFNVKDGLAIATWIKLGKKVAIITGRESKIVQRRADELHIQHIYQGIKNKREKLEYILKEEKLEYKQVAAIGDDLNDYLMLQSAGVSFTPQNGVDDIKDIVDIILSKNGGDGAIREMIDYIINKDGLKRDFIQLWL
jgi:3-deoxy-D-manno-octulosonate 8-phosphate phosphatase (KDO 8-P phosphatase)